MGNVPARALAQPPQPHGSAIDDLAPHLAYDRSLGHSRFLKTIKATHASGPVVVKVFAKADPGVSLLVHRRRLKGVHNVHPYQAMVETDRAAFLVRQFVANDLYDRISTRPFLAEIERKWLAFQLLAGMADIRALKLSHGDLKPSNVLVTSGLHVYLTDLSPFKPVHLPEDDPADFSFFFGGASASAGGGFGGGGGGGGRACYLAPERFFAPGSKAEQRRREALLEDGRRDGKVTEAMDVFAAGAVVTELWTDGRALFDLAGLLAYRAGETAGLELGLRQIGEAHVEAMVRAMLAPNPADRPSFAGLLARFRGAVFPEVFYTFLHEFACSLADLRLGTPGAAGGGEAEAPAGGAGEGEARTAAVADEKVARLWDDWDVIKSYLDTDAGEAAAPGEGSNSEGGVSHDGPALLVLNLLTAELRACHRPTSLIHAMALILRLANYVSDDAKLERAVPFLAALLEDDAAAVRATAVHTLTTLLEGVTTLSPTNTAVLPDFVLPHVRPLGHDPAVEVRVQYARSLAGLTATAERFLDLGESFRTLGGRDDGVEAGAVEEMSYDQSRAELETLVERELATLLSDPAPAVKRAVLESIASFGLFLGRQKTDDVVLSHLLTFLNDGDWVLRHDFVGAVVDVAALVGEGAAEQLLLPLVVQALADPEEAVLARVLAALRALAELELLGRVRLWEVAAAAVGLLAHPNVWIRQTSVGLLGAIANRLSFTDVWCILYPSARAHLRSETPVLTERALLDALLPPISRPAFDAALQWASKAPTSPFWAPDGPRPSPKAGGVVGTVARNARADVLAVLADAPEPARSDEDDAALAALRQKGLLARDEQRLALMRQHLLKLSRRQQSSSGPDTSFADEAPATLDVVPLNSLSITPRSIFFNIQPVAAGPSTGAGGGRRLKSRTASRASLPERRPTNLQSDGGRSSSAAEPLSLSRLRPLASVAHPPPPLPPIDLPAVVPSPTSAATPSESAPSSLAHHPPAKSAAQVGVALTTASAVLDGHSDRAFDELSEAEQAPARSAATPKEAPFEGAPARMSRDRIQGYDGTDPNIIRFLEVAYLDSFKESAADFGPRISPAAVSSRRKASASRTTVPSRTSAAAGTAADGSAPFLFLDASSPVVHLAASPDQIFFVSAHRDGSVRVWDSARLERNVASKPRLVHRLGAAPTALCFIEDTHCLAVATEDGAVAVLRVHIASPYTHPKFREVELVRFYQCELPSDYVAALSSVSAADGSMELVLATVRSIVLTLDLCAMRVIKTLELPLDHGPPSCVYADRGRQWIAVGTSLGVLSVWDARFALPVRSWRASAGGRVRFCLRHPLKSRWVLVASESAGQTFLQSYEVETGRLIEDFTTTSGGARSTAGAGSPEPVLVASSSAASEDDADRAMAQVLAGRAVQRASPPLTPPTAVLAIAVQPRAHQSTSLRADGAVSGPTVYTAGLAGRIRCLNFADLQRSRVLAPPGSDVKASYSYTPGTPAVTHETISSPPAHAAEPITSLCIVGSPVSSTTWLLSGSLSGALQAWKV